jgi:guanosine-3',5'-bis(diphosphate) 3'-pyrophosphohydrolase
MTDLAYRAMIFAREAHRNQRRKYTGNPYSDHLAEVAGIVASVLPTDDAIATAWLHDCIEDQAVARETLEEMFGPMVAGGVHFLSDTEEGNRAERKRASCLRLSAAPAWVQTIKVADLISNTSSIVMHDPQFSVVYLAEKKAMLDVLTQADPRLVDIARRQAGSRSHRMPA